MTSAFSVGHSPTFPELHHFPLKDGYINIAEEIANDYKSFGSFILDDERGSKVASIAKTEHDSVAITLEILRQWLQEKGRMPVTWLTLIKCLRDTGLNVLADDIKSALSQEGESKAPNNAGSSMHKIPDGDGPSLHRTPGPSVCTAPVNHSNQIVGHCTHSPCYYKCCNGICPLRWIQMCYQHRNRSFSSTV